ncbi:autotransporter outer membrane beta-barrel domain-containing protein [uncultured Phascolarctobacterium sp.]|uniref:autotransporter outer membrane beta-barrel domain-containing protein n=1 Tax=uncultured Phascolarctobacterium sp. TaxID=512296 RepID=UPI0025FDF101|nr:autotransporter outer membrane beta-barrel domain-containing protein [uncultured Phascolarctobacterium sp.]
MKFLAKMKEKQMQRKISGILCGLLCAGGVLVIPSAWADNYFGDNGKTYMVTGANVLLDSGNYDAVYGGYNNTNVSPPEVFKNNVTITGTVETNIVCGAYSFYGNVRENTVTISGNTLGNVVCGGGTGAADAMKNHVIIEANSEVNGIVYGGKGVTSSKENDVTISDSTINKTVYGGYADNDNNGSAEKNNVTISAGSKVSGSIYGGYANHNANENKVSFSNVAEVGENVFGGYSLKADSKKNEVTINGGSVVTANVAGGVAVKGNSEGNTVRIIKSSAANVCGGKGDTNSKENSVGISEGTIKDTVYGGYADNDNNSSAEKNNVTISAGSKVSGSIYGGYANHNANENKVSFSNVAEVGENVFGGYSLKADSKKNEVTINGGSVVTANVAGGVAVKGNSEGNTVRIIKSSAANVCGGKGDTNSKENSVGISEGTIKDTVYGGYADNDNNSSAEKNNVTIGAGSVIMSNVYGGYAIQNTNENKVRVTNASKVKLSVAGGYSEQGDSKKNEVTIEGAGVVTEYVAGGVAVAGISEGNKVNIAHSSVNENVYGGYGAKDSIGNIISITDGSSVNKNVYGGYSFKGNSLDNTVTIDNSTVNENVYGGYMESDGAISEKIQNNKVIFKNGAKIKGDVYGGYDNLSKANITNNTLEVVGKGNEAKSIQNFDKLNFFITKDLVANDTMLKVTGTALINNAEIKAGVELGTKLNENDKINLITAGALKAENITTGTLTDGLISIDQGIQVTVGTDGNKLVGVINGTTPPGGGGTTPPGGGGTTPPGGGGTTPGVGSLYADADAKSPVETQSAALTMLNLGHDLLTTAGYENAALAVDGEEEGSVNPFITMSANNQKLDTGSHVDLKAWNMNLGFAKKINNNTGKLLIAPVIEYGRGSYDSYLDNGTHGDGDAHFWGAGLMAKQLNDDGLYYEGSLRAGRMSTDYQSAVAGGIKYDSNATYYAAHLGMGKVVQLNDKDTLDYYGKLFYTRQQGDKVTVGTGATYDFDATTSLRTRLGARYTHQLSDKNAFYAGLAWQHEFDGESNAIVATTLGSASAPAPSMKGDTGIMELGWRVNNSDKFELGLGVNGSVGKQKGVGFNLSLNFSF